MDKDKISPNIVSKVFFIFGLIITIFVFLTSNKYSGANVVFSAMAGVPLFLIASIFSIFHLRNENWKGIANWLILIVNAPPLFFGFIILVIVFSGHW